MGRRCCVASCDNAVNSTLFAMPKDDILFCMWCKVLAAIGINLQKKHFICEQHFEKNFIKDTVIIKDKDEKILFQRTLQRKTLLKDAIPSIFGNKIICPNFSEAIHDKNNEDNLSSEQQIEDNTEIIDNSHENCPLQISRNKEKDCSSNISQRNDFFLKQNEQDMTVINLENSVNENPVNDDTVFSSIFAGRMKIQLPNERWSYSLQNFDQKILFHEISEITKQEKIPYWFTKQVVLNADLSMDVYAISKYVTTFNQLRTHLDVQVAINKIAQMKACIGGPSTVYYKSVTPRCAYKDITAHWRHYSPR